MVGKIKSLNEVSGTLFEFGEEATLPFLASDVVGELSVGDYATFDVSWVGTTRSIVNVTKRA